MQLACFSRSPHRDGKLMCACKFLCGGPKISILHFTRFSEFWREQLRRVGQRIRIWRGIKLVEEVREAAVEGIAVNRQLRDFR